MIILRSLFPIQSTSIKMKMQPHLWCTFKCVLLLLLFLFFLLLLLLAQNSLLPASFRSIIVFISSVPFKKGIKNNVQRNRVNGSE